MQTNLVGGNDELVFDGQSLVVNTQGDLLAIGNEFREDIFVVDTSVLALPRKPWKEDESTLFYAYLKEQLITSVNVVLKKWRLL